MESIKPENINVWSESELEKYFKKIGLEKEWDSFFNLVDNYTGTWSGIVNVGLDGYGNEEEQKIYDLVRSKLQITEYSMYINRD